MKRWCGTFAGLWMMAAAAQAAPVAEVMAVLGEAQADGKALAVGARLEPGAELRTGAKGRVRLRFVDGSSVVVSDDSRVRIQQFEPAANGQPRKATLWLELGLIGQKVAPGGGWEVRTPTAVTAVRGTEFVVEVNGDQATAVHVQAGEVAVQASSRTRGILPRPPVVLDTQADGTQCSVAGCEAAKRWSGQKVQDLQGRLAGV